MDENAATKKSLKHADDELREGLARQQAQYDKQQQAKYDRENLLTKPAIATKIGIQSQVGNTRMMTFETYVDHATPKEVINELVDIYMKVAERQALRGQIMDLETYIITETNKLVSLQSDLETYKQAAQPKEVEGRRLPKEPSAKDVAAVTNTQVSIAQSKLLIQKLRDQKEASEEKLASM